MCLVFINHDKVYHTSKKGKCFGFSHFLATKQTRETRNPKQCEMEDSQKYTPWKISMDHNHGGFEDHFPFQMGDL